MNLGGERTGPARALEVLLGAALVVAATAALHRLGSGPLEAPPLTSVAEIRIWVDERDAPTVGLAIARLVLLVVCYHLVVTTAVALVGRAFGRPDWVRLADAATLPPLRGPARRLAGLGLSVAAAVAPTVPPVAAGPPPPAHTSDVTADAGTAPGATGDIRRAATEPAPGGSTVTLEVLDGDGTDQADLVRVPDLDLDTERATPRRPEPRSETDAHRETDPDDHHDESAPANGGHGIHVVAAGDHLWSIAEQTLRSGSERAPTVDQIATYWRTVLAANPQLVDPDLIHPGETITLPPPP